jgi:RNA polymerase-binding protein DksA
MATKPKLKTSPKPKPPAAGPKAVKSVKAVKAAPAVKGAPAKAAPAKAAPAKAAPAKAAPAKPKAAASQRPPAKAKAAAPPKVAAPSKPAAPKAPPPKRAVFNAKALAGIKDNLLALRAEYAEQLEEIEEASFTSSQSDLSGEVGYDDDYADAGSFTFEREKDLSIANNVQDLLDKIAKALDKIDEGTYGLCESCGDPISAERLKALPYVLLCIKCKKAEERR